MSEFPGQLFFSLRFGWGPEELTALAPTSDVVVIVDVLDYQMDIAEAVEHQCRCVLPDAILIATVPLEQHPITWTAVAAGAHLEGRPWSHEQHDGPLVVAHDGPRQSGPNYVLLVIDRAPHDRLAGVYVSHMCTLTLVL